MELIKISVAAKRLGISVETARKKAKTEWTTYRLGPKSVVVDFDQILQQSKVQKTPELEAPFQHRPSDKTVRR